MTKAKFKIENELDLKTAYKWVKNKLALDVDFLGLEDDREEDEDKEGYQFDFEKKEVALKEFSLFSEYNLEGLNSFCEKYLSTSQWSKLKTTIRVSRNRLKKSQTGTITKSIDISLDAHYVLSMLAKRHNVTLSAFLENTLNPMLDKEVQRELEL